MIVYNEDDLPGYRVEPYDAQHVKRLEAENARYREALEKIVNIDGPILDQLDECVAIARAALEGK